MTNGLSSIMFSPYADRIDRLPSTEGYKYNAIPQRRIAGMPSKSITDQIIDLSAQDVPPKEIAAQLGVDPQKVYYVRSHWCGSIDARRKELAGQNIDGTPASVAHKPEGSAPVKIAPMKDLTPEEAFDKIMQTIEPPVKEEPEPAAQGPSADFTQVGEQAYAGFKAGLDADTAVVNEAFKEALRESKDEPTALAVFAPVGMRIRSIELSGAAGTYELTAEGVAFSSGFGATARFSHGQLPEFVNDLNAIQRFSVDWGRVANG